MTFSSPQQYEEQYAQGYRALNLLSPQIIFEPSFKKGFQKISSKVMVISPSGKKMFHFYYSQLSLQQQIRLLFKK